VLPTTGELSMTTIKDYGTIAHASIEHNGETRPLKEWATHLDLDYSVLRMRYKRGKRGAELFHATPNGRFKTSMLSVNTLPSFYYTLPHNLKVRLMAESDGDKEKMQRLMELALKVFFNETNESFEDL
jgi:hypothetical protein